MIVASVGVHVLLWPVGNQVLTLGWDAPPMPEGGSYMEVSLLDPEEKDPSALPGQLVQPDHVLDERPPKDSDRISEFDSRVERETRAPLRPAAREYSPDRVGEEAGRSAEDSKPASEDEVPSHALPLGRFDPTTSDDQGHRLEPGSLPVDERGRGSNEAGGSAPPPRSGLRGNAEAMRKTFGGSGSHDALDGLDEGGESLLNTHRFRFSSFFNRLRNQIAQYWDPNEVMHRIDSEGRIYGNRTRRTLLHLRLTPEGAVEKIDIVKGCGVLDLDKEAIESVHLAAPFVNPPPEMVDENTGFIEIDFSFVLTEGRATIHRYRR